MQGQTGSCTYVGAACSTTGTQVCSSSCTPGACQPPVDTCDHTDEDCDGFVDDDLTLGGGATVGSYGAGGAPLVDATWVPSLGSGTGAIAWVDSGSSSGPWTLKFVTFRADGTPFITQQSVATLSAEPTALQIVHDGSAWAIFYLLGTGTSLQLLRVNNSGGIVSGPSMFPASGSGMVRYFDVAQGDGEVGVVFASGGPSDVQAAVYGAGVLLGSFTLDGSTSTSRPVAVAWMGGDQFVGFASDPSGVSTTMQRFRASGRTGGATGLLGGSNTLPQDAAWEPASGLVLYTMFNNAPSGSLQGLTVLVDPGSGGIRTVRVLADTRPPGRAVASDDGSVMGATSGMGVPIRLRTTDDTVYPATPSLSFPRAIVGLVGPPGNAPYLVVETNTGNVQTRLTRCP